MEFTALRNELQQAIAQAEEYAIGNLQESITFSPYIFLGEKNIRKILADNIDKAIETAQEEIEDLTQETVVFVYSDVVKLADGECNAIVTQLFNEDEDNGYSYGLLYKMENNKITFSNQRVFLGNIRNCLIF
ncbi:hypothetical protein EG359_01045 [Chryseobacterium joostei]|uniref:DUF4440 domain-containing protein n=1 Tax=Chryseobacterium joostei TaxID=112234 RepID=A0A1N7IRX8_9FLAO|nr:hypothetical protein [Chryseobacterium joostei]AZA98273.1 hypothetical protein EG359_01045 [Chryseobacterium joostei]SIS39854.1 hypothetical protein SAMN05421768_106320 [Chryseobacterium joostei]